MSRTTDGDREVVGWSLLLTARILRVLHLAHTVPCVFSFLTSGRNPTRLPRTTEQYGNSLHLSSLIESGGRDALVFSFLV